MIQVPALARNFRYGLRQLHRSPGFACAAIFTIALGIAANVAMFSIVWAVFLAPLPYPHGDRMVVVWTHYKGERQGTISDDYAEYVAANRSFQRLDFESWRSLHLTNEDHTEDEIIGSAITPGFITGHSGLKMALGRDFRPDEGLPGTDHVTILDHSLWASRYHSDPAVIGKTIGINGDMYAVVGVQAPAPGDRGEGKFSVPVIVPLGSHLGIMGNVFGLLKPGATIAQAQAEVAAIDRRLAAKRNGGKGADAWSISVEPLHNDWLDPKLACNLWLLLAAVGLVLLIACANVANLLIARGESRSHEFAVRNALGASRGAIFAQLLVESLTLASIGGLLGIGFGWGLMKVAMSLLPNLVNQTWEAKVGMNLPVLGFALLITLLTGVLAGCMPAWKAGKINLSGALSQGSRSMMGQSRSRIQAVLVAGDFALALTLLSGAGMVLHSFWKMSHIDLGFGGDRVLTGFLSPGPNTDRRNFKMPPPEQTFEVNREILARLSGLPGVSSAGLSTSFPLQEHGAVPVSVAGAAVDNPQRMTAGLQWVTPGYQQTFQIRLARGRFLDDSDTLGHPVSVVVNETLVRRYLQGADPLQRRRQIRNAAGAPRMLRPKC